MEINEIIRRLKDADFNVYEDTDTTIEFRYRFKGTT